MTGGSAREKKTPFGSFELRRSHLTTGPNPYPPGSKDAGRFEAMRHFPATGTADPHQTLDPVLLRRVQLTVAAHSTGAADCRVLLEVLGLVDAPVVEEP